MPDDLGEVEKQVLETIKTYYSLDPDISLILKPIKKEQHTHCAYCDRSRSVNKSIDRCDCCGARFKL